MSHGPLVEFTDANFPTDVLESSQPVIVDFWAEWCGPCKMLTPIMERLATAFEGKVRMGKLNVDENPETAAKYGIVSIPSILFIKGGKVLEQHTGLLPEAALKTKISGIFGE
ncbi:MAG: thioredoxin [Chitinispirillaceae bacterium]|nr:thioredoxin [Chitinispirillaceae bacterium]